MEINDRINQIIEHEHLSVAAFARKIGIGDQTVRSVCVLRRNKPGFEFLSNLIQTFEWLDPKWLLTGEGRGTNVRYNIANTTKAVEIHRFGHIFISPVIIFIICCRCRSLPVPEPTERTLRQVSS